MDNQNGSHFNLVIAFNQRIITPLVGSIAFYNRTLFGDVLGNSRHGIWWWSHFHCDKCEQYNIISYIEVILIKIAHSLWIHTIVVDHCHDQDIKLCPAKLQAQQTVMMDLKRFVIVIQRRRFWPRKSEQWSNEDRPHKNRWYLEIWGELQD